MKLFQDKIIEWFLRLVLSAGFLSATADRFGFWSKEISVWGNWDNFVAYTKILNPIFPEKVIPILAYFATGLEIVLGFLLLITFKTELIAKLSGLLLLLFGISMFFSIGIKPALDYSVFTASAAAFALSFIVQKKLNK